MKILLTIFFIVTHTYNQAFSQCSPVIDISFNGNGNDVSGNANHATASGTPTLTKDRFGTANSAYHFGGFYDVDYFTISHSTSMTLTNKLSVSYWFRQCTFGGMDGYGAYSATGQNILWAKHGDGYAAAPGIWSGLTVVSNQMNWFVANKNGYGSTAVNFQTQSLFTCIDTCEWIHVVTVVDSNKIRTYFNSKLVKTDTTNVADFSVANTKPLLIGKMDGTWYPFQGDIDDFKYYKCALNQSKIDSLYGGYTDPKQANNIIKFDSVKLSKVSCINHTISLYPNSLAGPFQYSKDSGTNWQTSNSFTNLNTGTYKIAIKSACTRKDTVITIQPCVFDLDVSGSFSTCLDTISIAQNLTITDGDLSVLIDGAKIYFDAGYIKLEDSLTINTQFGITASFDTATGVLHLSGNATKSQYETVLKTIKYKNLKTNKTIATKSIRFVLGKALYNANNGHYYKIINNGTTINWSVARDSCIASKFFGLQGYLVTLTDSSENDFVFKLIKDNSWIGASDATAEGVWRWVTGCEGLENGGLGRHFSNQIGSCGATTGTGTSANGNFQNWWTGEPNDASCIEEYGQFVILGNGKWNDLPNSAGISKYIIEYGCMPNDPIIDIQGSVTVNLINSSFNTITQTICQGDSFLSKKATGIYKDTFTSSNGCDSIRTLNLTVNPRTTSTISQTICQGDSFLGRKFSGTYIDTLKKSNSKGCDSIRTLNLTVNPITSSTANQAICSGQSFWGYTTTGVYRDTFRNANSKGCDSIRILNLTASPNILNILTITRCQSYFFKGQNRTVSGTYRDTTILSSGCDSITELCLTIPVASSLTIDTGSCDSFKYKTKTYKINSNILDTIKSSINCDSIFKTIRLTIYKPTTLPKDSLTACREITYQNQNYFRDTILNIRIPKTVFPFCDSLLKTVKLSVFPKPNATLTATPDSLVKYGESISLEAKGGIQYKWNVSNLSTSKISIPIQVRTYVEVKVTDFNQCDSTVGLWLDNLPELNVTEAFSPNGDGKNDLFTPSIQGNVIIHSWRIFNRWGQKIFESNSLLQGWDGKFTGLDQPQGSYVYQIEYTLNKVKTIKTGAVTLIR